MRSTHEIVIDAPVEPVWAALGTLESLLAALPGATLEAADGAVRGSLRLRLGSVQVTYRVEARATRVDATAHAATLTVTGTQSRGNGGIDGTLEVDLRALRQTSAMSVTADVEVTGRAEAATQQQWDRALAGLVSPLGDLAGGSVASIEPATQAAATQTAATQPATPAASPRPVAGSRGVEPEPSPQPSRPPLAAVPPFAASVNRRSPAVGARVVAAAAGTSLLAVVVIRRRRRRRTRWRR